MTNIVQKNLIYKANVNAGEILRYAKYHIGMISICQSAKIQLCRIFTYNSYATRRHEND
jgi:hypothetical protein